MIPFVSGSWWLSLSHMFWPVALVLFAVGIMLASLAAALWTMQVFFSSLLLSSLELSDTTIYEP